MERDALQDKIMRYMQAEAKAGHFLLSIASVATGVDSGRQPVATALALLCHGPDAKLGAWHRGPKKNQRPHYYLKALQTYAQNEW